MLNLALCFVKVWVRMKKFIMDSAFSVLLCYSLRGKEKLVMCASVIVMLYYRVGEKDVNGEGCCSYLYVSSLWERGF